MANGQQINIGQGTLTADSPESDALSGSEATTAAGTSVASRLVLLKSRKTVSGSANRALTGNALVIAQGSVLGGPGAALVGGVLTFSQGAFTKGAARALSGTAVSAAQAVIGPPAPDTGTGLTVTFTPAEGYATTNGLPSGSRPRLTRSQMFYEGAFTTKDGTIIEAFDGTHSTDVNSNGTVQQNRVGEWDPATGAMTEVFPVNSSLAYPSGEFGVTSYDNLIYVYFDRIDSLVVANRGVYDRTLDSPTNDASGASWKYTNEPTVKPLGRPPMYTTTINATAFAYLGPSVWIDGFNEHIGYFNVHTAYSKQLDVAVIIGGASGGGPMDLGKLRLSFFVPSALISSSIVAPYSVVHRSISSGNAYANGKLWLLHEGRAGCCFLNGYVYWCGGRDNLGVNKSSLFRANVASMVASGDILNAPFTVENLQDAPCPGFTAGAMTADPHSNTLHLFNGSGVFVYDVSAGTWQEITSSLTEYVNAFASDNSYIGFPHAAYVDYRGTTKKRRTYWFGGCNGTGISQSTSHPTYVDRFDKVRSIAVTRGQIVSALTVQAEDPTNPAATIGPDGIGPLHGIKHHAIIENYIPGYYDPGASNRKITLCSGDWDYGWPTGQRSDFPSNPYWSSDGRQEMWYADTSSVAPLTASSTNSGTLRFKLAQNFYHNYPWNGSTGYSGAGGFSGVEPARGPYMPDGVGFTIDKRGEYWVGPCTIGYTQVTGEVGGEGRTNGVVWQGKWSPVYKWSMPSTHPVTGVRLGNGWTRPSQNRIKYPAGGGSPGVEFDVGIFSDSETAGWGRPNTTAYDPVTDALYVVGVQSSATTLNVALYRMKISPAVYAANGNQYLWERIPLATKSMAALNTFGLTGGHNDSTDQKNGLIANTVVCNGRLYFTFVAPFPAAAGYRNAGTWRNCAWILSADLTNPSASTVVDWLPFPEAQNWWLRAFDGPQSEEAWATLDEGGAPLTPGTPAQYRSMKAVGNKIVLGPDAYHNITKDPWISVYDTTTKTWNCWEPPANYAITNGGQDWPHSLFNVTAVPSLGEVWLTGQATQGPVGSIGDQFLASNGLHRPSWFQQTYGTWIGRRIIRMKV